VQALRVEWQPDPESPRRLRGCGPIGVRSEDVDYSRVKNRSNRSHRISRVVHNHFCRHQETGNKKTANLHQVTVNVYLEDFFVIPALAEITSSETFVSKKAPWRLHRQVAVSGFYRTSPDAYSLILRVAENLNGIPKAADNQSGICKAIFKIGSNAFSSAASVSSCNARQSRAVRGSITFEKITSYGMNFNCFGPRHADLTETSFS
jgi:hypothetical protein